MKKLQLKINGMELSSSADNLEKALSLVEGVSRIGIHYPSQEALIEFDETRVTLHKLIQLIDDAGYTAIPYLNAPSS